MLVILTITITISLACSDLNAPLTTMVELIMFVTMGLGLVLVWPLILSDLQFEAFVLLLIGGGFYIVGILFFILGEYKPIYHVIWHLFVVCGAAVHWFDIYFFVVQTDLMTSPTKAAVSAATESFVNMTSSFMHAASNLGDSAGILTH